MCACKHTQSDRRTHRYHPIPPHPELTSLQVKYWCVLDDFSNGLAESHMNNLKWTAGAPWLLCRFWNSGCGPGHAAPFFSLPSSSSSFCPSPLGNKTTPNSRIGRSFWNKAETSLPAWLLRSFYCAAVFLSWQMTLSDPAFPVPEAAAPFQYFSSWQIGTFKKFYWNIVGLQCCDNFYCRAQWFGYTYVYVLFHTLFHYGLFQDIECSSRCYPVGPSCLSILYVIVRIC